MFYYSIDFEQFCEWITSDVEIQEFLVEYMSYQTREHALRIYTELFNKYMSCFKIAADSEEEGKEAIVIKI